MPAIKFGEMIVVLSYVLGRVTGLCSHGKSERLEIGRFH